METVRRLPFSMYQIREILIFLVCIFILFNSSEVVAYDPSFIFEGHFLTAQDGMTKTNTTLNQSSVYAAGLYLKLLPKGSFYLGADFLSGSAVESVDSGTKAQNSYQDVLLGARYQFGKKEVFSLIASYGVASKASYNLSTASATEKWTGTSYLFRLAIHPIIKGSWRLLVTLNYYSSNYRKELTDELVGRSFLFPTVGISYAPQ